MIMAAPSAIILREGFFCDEESYKVDELSVEPETFSDDDKEMKDPRAVGDGSGDCRHRGSCRIPKALKEKFAAENTSHR